MIDINKASIVITSINNDTMPAFEAFNVGVGDHSLNLIIIGDKKSPSDFFLSNAEFISFEQSGSLGFNFSSVAVANHYSRKNIGYLLAFKYKSPFILDTDDDNIPLDNFWEKTYSIENNSLQVASEDNRWINIYSYFSNENIWPRGFPLPYIKDDLVKLSSDKKDFFSPIQAGLADGNPDVDAIYRFTGNLPIKFKKNINIALDEGCYSPFNSQNTIWFPQAYSLMYLPSTCSFRMTDIWRSFIAQYLLWGAKYNVSFFSPTVYQVRNEHDLLKDFSDEIEGYLGYDQFIDVLENSKLRFGEAYFLDDLFVIYENLVQEKFFTTHELDLLTCWIKDCRKILGSK